MRGDGVDGERRVVGVPTFLNINSDWMSNASSGLCIYLHTILGKNSRTLTKPGLRVVTYFDSAHN